jgi:hypothetical protein
LGALAPTPDWDRGIAKELVTTALDGFEFYGIDRNVLRIGDTFFDEHLMGIDGSTSC